jgi:O-antigen/teichoic acid export membrane protein
METIYWVLIIAVVFIVLFFLRAKNTKHKYLVIIVILVILFIYITAAKIFEVNKPDLKTFDGTVSAGKLYFSWLAHAFGNVKAVTGNVVKMDWEGNSTNTTK